VISAIISPSSIIIFICKIEFTVFVVDDGVVVDDGSDGRLCVVYV